MKWGENFYDYLKTVLKRLIPKAESDKIHDEIQKLDEANPENFGKLAMMNLRLSNGYAMITSVTDNKLYNHRMVDLYYDKYKYFRAKYLADKN